MVRFHFSLRGLLLLVSLVAVGCAGLFNASPLWASVVYTAATVLLLTAVVGAICRRGRAQAFWLGFAVLGHGYAWLAGTCAGFDPPFVISPIPVDVPDREGPRLLTTRLLDWTYATLYPAAPRETGTGFFSVDDGPLALPGEPDGSEAEVTVADYPSYSTFLCVGESLWTLLFACFGGLLGRYFYATREKTQ